MANKNYNSYGSGDMANENNPKNVMGIAEAGKVRMNSYAKGGGLMGFMAGGDVVYGATKKATYGNMGKPAKRK